MSRRGVFVGVCGLCFATSVWGESYGGQVLGTNVASNCIPSSQRIAAQERLNAFAASHRSGVAAPAALPQAYRFQPVAGALWQDRHILNFFDVDASPEIRDWDCSDYTYDGHTATDIVIRGFGEQDAGVPVFAALDGVVAHTHDGENDRNTTLQGQPANYVILFHGGTHYSWYWHVRKGSVAVSVGEEVRAGSQIGQVGSSGHSEAPHLHFQSEFDGYAYETYSGPCHAGPRHWVNQAAIPRHTWISDFAMHNRNDIPAAQFYPHDPPRAGAFALTGAAQPIGAWYVIHNEPANSTWRARYLRPDGTTGYDSGTRSRNNSFHRFAAWWFSFSFDPAIAGTWTLQLIVNDTILVNAPFLVLSAGSAPTNRPPRTPTAIAFDPPTLSPADPLFCRLTVPFLPDADYDLVSYQFHWFIDGLPFRKVTNAAYADAIPRGAALPGDSVRCVVTPYDGRQFGSPITAELGASILSAPRIVAVPANGVVISWPTSVVNYTLEAISRLGAAGGWNAASGTAVRIGDRMVLTNAVNAPSQFYRLKRP